MGKPENEIESYLGKLCVQNNLLYYKFMSGQSGVPDRIIIGNNKTIFVELKRPHGNNLQHIQRAVIKDMKAHGAIVYVVFNKLQAEELIKKLTKGMPKKKSYAVQHKEFLDNLGKSYKIYSVDS